MSARLAVESLAARAASKLSRIAGTGGGTTLPGKLLWKLDPGRSTRSRRGSATAPRWSPRRTARRRRPRWRPRSWHRSGGSPGTAPARTSSPVSPRPCSRSGTPTWGCSRSTKAPSGGRPPRAAAGRAARQSLPRPARPLRRAGAHRRALAGCDGRPAVETILVVNGDDPQVGELARGRDGAIVYGIDDPRHARPALQRRLALLRPVQATVRVRGRVLGHLGDYRCPARRERPPLQVQATEIELGGLHAPPRSHRDPERVDASAPAASRPLQRLQRARRRRLAQALGASLEVRSSSSGSRQPSAASSGSRPATEACSCSWSRIPPERASRAHAARGGAPPSSLSH